MSPYNSMQNNPIGYADPEGDWIHIAVGAVIGGVINTATHWDEIKKDGLWAGVKAFGIGAGAGVLTAVTGGAAVGAGFAQGAVIGAGSGIVGDIVLQTGNLLAFGDEFNTSQTLLAGGIGALGGGQTGHFTKANPAAGSNGPTAEVFDEFIDPYAVHSVSGGGNIVKTGGAIDDIAFSVGRTDEFVVSATRTYSNAYKIAESGGKHSGFLKTYLGKSAKGIRKAMNTLQNGKRGINVHLDKIQNPTKYVRNWDNLRPGHQQNLLRGWEKEIINGRQQISILNGILGG